MSRDFIVQFDNASDANQAQQIFESYTSQTDSLRIFNVDNRGDSLFIELEYSKDIGSEFSIGSSITGEVIHNFADNVAFVAIKNGEHVGIGNLIITESLVSNKTIPLRDVRGLIESLVRNKEVSRLSESASTVSH